MGKADLEKLHVIGVRAGEKRSSAASKHCFQHLIPVYQLLVYPVIGQL